jgi:hypothetical protein
MYNWKEEIPFIELARGVPVVPVVPGNGRDPQVCLGVGRGGSNAKVTTKSDGPLTTKATNWRADLDDPMGFMYALMWLYGQYAGDGHWKPLFEGRVDVMRGDYSDADIAELVREMKKAVKVKS